MAQPPNTDREEGQLMATKKSPWPPGVGIPEGAVDIVRALSTYCACGTLPGMSWVTTGIIVCCPACGNGRDSEPTTKLAAASAWLQLRGELDLAGSP